MASEKSESNVGYPMEARAPSHNSLNAPPDFHAYQQPASGFSHYPIPRMPHRKLPFSRPPKKEGLGKSYVLVGSYQIFMGLMIFVLALIGLSVSRNGSAYSAGFVGGIAFMITGAFGCVTGSYDGDCYPMTYYVLNVLSIPAALLCIALSGWEINGMGIATVLRSSEGYLTVKCVLVILGSITVLILSAYQAYKLRSVECCEWKIGGNKERRMPQGNPYPGPMDYGPVSNQTTNSSWAWNMQHNVNQPQHPQDYPLHQQDIHQQYLDQIESKHDPYQQEQYGRQDRDEASTVGGGSIQQPAYI